MRSLVLGLSVVIALTVSSTASAMSVVGTDTETANVVGFISFDFLGVTPTGDDSGTLTLTSSSAAPPLVFSGELTFAMPVVSGTPTSSGPSSFTFSYDILSGLASASADGMFEVNALATPGVTYVATVTSAGGTAVIPEPGVLSMLCIGGVVGCMGVRRRRD